MFDLSSRSIASSEKGGLRCRSQFSEDMFRFSGRRNRKSFILFELVRVLAFTIIGVPVLIALAAGTRR